MNDQEVTAYHARRLLVAPPRGHRVRVDPLHRVARGVKHLVDYVFVVVYALLTARLVLLLVPASLGGILTRMLAPVTDPLILPFVSWLPAPDLPDHLALLQPILAAAVAAFVAHRLVQVLLRPLARPRLAIVRQIPSSLVTRVGRVGMMDPAR